MKTKLQFLKTSLVLSLFTFMLGFTAQAQVPANDDISGAIAVTMDQTFTGVAIQNATASGVASAGCSLGGVSTVWYSHTALSAGTVSATILNPGPNLDPAVGRFNIVAWYIDGGGAGLSLEERLVLAPGSGCTTGNTSLIATTVSTTYYAQIDNSGTVATDIAFAFGAAPPVNDVITGAIDINPTGVTNFTGVNTQNATGASGGGMVGCDLGGALSRVYYRFQPTVDSSITTSINNAATTGTILILWYESAIPNATADSDLTLPPDEGCLTNANPMPAGLTTGRTVAVAAGSTYYCVVSHPDAAADITFTVGAAITRPSNDQVQNALNVPNPLPFTTPVVQMQDASGASFGATGGSNLGGLPRTYYRTFVNTTGTVTATIDTPTATGVNDAFIIPFRSSQPIADDDDLLTLADTEGGAFALGATQTITATAGTAYYWLARNNGPSTITFTGTATLSTELVTEKLITIYPNPARDELNIEGNVLFNNVEVVNMLGQQVLTSTMDVVTDSFRLNTEDLSTGQYIIKITGADGSITSERFIKE